MRVGVNASFGDTFANPKRTVHKRSMTSMRGIQRSYAEIKGFVPKAGSSTTANLEVSLAAPACAAPACAGCMAVWILSAISWCACFASNAFFLYCAFIRKLPEGAIWRDRVASLCLGLYASMTVSGLQMGVFLKECFWECFFRVVATPWLGAHAHWRSRTKCHRVVNMATCSVCFALPITCQITSSSSLAAQSPTPKRHQWHA